MKKLITLTLFVTSLFLFSACNLLPISPEISEREVYSGIDLIDGHLNIFSNERVGLITNATGIDKNFNSTIDILYEKVNLTALFAPEHGIRGERQAGEAVGSYQDKKTGLTVYSLYGNTKRPTKEMLENVDILCIDLQDVGSRFYTYIYTMAYAMEACRDYNKKFVVFDRPNPLGGAIVEGNILELEYRSFVGYYPLVQRHGMTIGELALLFNTEYEIGCDLTVIKMENWERNMYFEDTKLPWVIPSPNMPTINTAIVYPGTCVFEGTNLSEGRGTTKPFELIGAPYIDAIEFANALNDLNLSGVMFRPAYFTPIFSKHTGKLCGGVEVHVTNRHQFSAVKVGLAMLDIVRDLYPDDFEVLNGNRSGCMLDLLTGTRRITLRLDTLQEQFAVIKNDSKEFNNIRLEYLLY